MRIVEKNGLIAYFDTFTFVVDYHRCVASLAGRTLHL